MNYIVSPHAQGTDGWKQDRCGKGTGSAIAAIFAKTAAGKPTAARADYCMQLVLELLTGAPAENDFTNKEMEWGTAQEPYSRMAYETATGLMVEEAGFCYLTHIRAGCSVDGFVVDKGRKGIWESKSPKSKTHLGYIEAGVVPAQYIPQIEHNLWITGAQFCDFQSFDPRFPPKLQRFCVRLERDEARITAHAAAVKVFLAEVDALETKLRQMAA